MVFGRLVASLPVSIVLNITAILLKVSDVSDEDVLHQQSCHPGSWNGNADITLDNVCMLPL